MLDILGVRQGHQHEHGAERGQLVGPAFAPRAQDQLDRACIAVVLAGGASKHVTWELIEQ
jgi:hypothetical protein